MGAICCVTDETTLEIEKKMDEDHQKDYAMKKLLFLGAGGAGKSTIFKQLKRIHNQSLSELERHEHVETIRTELISSMKTLIKKAQDLYRSDKRRFHDCKLTGSDPNVRTAIEQVFRTMEQPVELGDILVDYLKILWRLPAIQATWEFRQHFAIPESSGFFFNEIDRVCAHGFRPSEEDLLLTRVRTTGIVEAVFDYRGNDFKVVDVGGQRNERKKWAQCFDNVTAVIFVASLSSYCEVLFEDERKNGMEESLALFETVANSDAFEDKDIILFLNKADLFEDRIRRGISLSECFGDEYTGSNYRPGRPQDEFEDALRDGLHFIQGQYSAQKRHDEFAVYIHITRAIEVDNVQKVFWDVQNIVLRGALKKGHLL